MRSEELFAMGLGLTSPWIVRSSLISDGELHIHIDFEKGSKFDGCSVHDTVDRSWRHLNFWQYPTYLHARVPRVVGPDGKVKQVDVPWARPGSGFTALFEALALTMCKSMPMSQVAASLHLDDMALWRLAEKSFEFARSQADYSSVTRVGVDETSSRKGHRNITKFVDLDRRRVLFVCQGKGSESIERFAQDFKAHSGQIQKIKTFSCDMSAAFLSGIAQHFPKAEVVLDKFHLVKMVSEAVDLTRRTESKGSKDIKGTRFLWLKNPSNLKDSERARLRNLLQAHAYEKTAEAYRLRLAFQDLFRQPKRMASYYLYNWLDAALECGVPAMESVAETFFNMRSKILSWFDHRVSNGVLEGLNSVLQSVKNRARGYANPNHLILMSYLLHGGLDLSPTALKART